MKDRIVQRSSLSCPLLCGAMALHAMAPSAAGAQTNVATASAQTTMHVECASRLNIVDRDGLLGRPGVVRDDLRLFDPLDGVTPLNNKTRIYH